MHCNSFNAAVRSLAFKNATLFFVSSARQLRKPARLLLKPVL
jgi:hypothetical protein